MDSHPAAGLFPMMGEAELGELAEDIAARGLLEPIKLLDGLVIDGRNRAAACEVSGVEPAYESVVADDPVTYVVSLNVKRRNLTKDQLAVSAAEAWPMYESKMGRPEKSAESRPTNPERTRDVLAKLFGPGRSTLRFELREARPGGMTLLS